MKVLDETDDSFITLKVEKRPEPRYRYKEGSIIRTAHGSLAVVLGLAGNFMLFSLILFIFFLSIFIVQQFVSALIANMSTLSGRYFLNESLLSYVPIIIKFFL